MGEEKKQKNKTRPKNKMRQQQQKTVQTKPHATLSEFSLHLFIYFLIPTSSPDWQVKRPHKYLSVGAFRWVWNKQTRSPCLDTDTV